MSSGGHADGSVVNNLINPTSNSSRISVPSVENPLNRISIIAVAAALLGTCSCLGPTGHVSLEYASPSPAAKVAEAGSPHVAVEVADKRPTQVVGQKFNGVWMPTSDIVSDTDVPSALKSAFDTELAQRGFILGPGGNLVSVTLNTLQSRFTGPWLAPGPETTAEMAMGVAVKLPNGAVVYDKSIAAQNRERLSAASCWEADKMPKSVAKLDARLLCNARDTLNAAMQDAVLKIFSDGTFIDVLRKP